MDVKNLQDLVLRAVSLHGDTRAAVTFDSGSGSSASLSYRELVELGNTLSHILLQHCAGNGGVIGLYCYTDLYLPVWILGILQLPAAYVPFDPDGPVLLSARVMTQCGLQYCALQSDLLERFQTDFSELMEMEVCVKLSSYNLTLVRVQLLAAASAADHNAAPQTKGQSRHHADVMAKDTGQEDLAYVLHTSGTTGLPKTVRVPHKCIVPNILHLRSLFQMTVEDVVFLASPLTFDPSVVEMFLALSSGACLLIVPTVIRKMPQRLAQILFNNHRPTVLQVTPTLLGRFGRRALREQVLCTGSSVRVLALGGEACPSPALLRSWRQEGNQTCIYNIYGITEVSCWACCYRVPESLLLQSNSQAEWSMPLGTPLMGTSVEVRDDRGCIVTEGEGQVLIGGQDRVCLLDSEVTAVPGTMRTTGDWVEVRDKHMYYLGRRDRLVKRHGQRVNLDNLQQVLNGLPQVEMCAVGLQHQGSGLVAFVVPLTPGARGGGAASPPPPPSDRHRSPDASSEHQGDPPSSSTDLHHFITSDRSLQKAILQQLSLLLPGPSVPDTLVLVPALPLSSHGKVDMAALMKIYELQRERLKSDATLWDLVKLRRTLQFLWQDALGVSEDKHIEEDHNFLFSGGDSLKALRLCDDITTATGVTSAGLLEVILDGSFADMVGHVAGGTLALPYESGSASSTPGAKKRLAAPLSVTLAKRERKRAGSTHYPADAEQMHRAVKVIRRAGQVSEMNISVTEAAVNSQSNIVGQTSGEDTSVNTDDSHSLTVGPTQHSANDTLHQGYGQFRNLPTNDLINEDSKTTAFLFLEKTGVVGLSVSWRSDTGRCVDASPVILVQGEGPGAGQSPVILVQGEGPGAGQSPERATVFIGSHSHRMQALDLATGEILWERVLGDRIESSAAVTRCGRLVVVGSYDGCVYFLCVVSGETRWVFETGDAVKCCPAVDPLTGLVMVGSHDGHVYALNPQVGQCVWRRHCGGGAVFSSPCLHSSHRRVYVASLGGHLNCLNADSGEVLWTHSRETPFFSSPNVSSGGLVVVGSVDGNICCFTSTGTPVWQFLTRGPVFSSPCFTPDQRRVLCGSHDGSVYCLNCTDGSLVWSFHTSAKVYSSPCMLDAAGCWLVALASTDGTVWLLDAEKGTLAASLTLPGELFSSPVAWGRSLVVGCRNDYVYCMELTVGSQSQRNS